ncbi:MAG TPA: DUF4290 domain-containing protein [Bacteroidales bacterium]|jgi:hypothetical protein|nr:MAG: hypothetical protein BWX51_01205 [Bacteroidetes bacterium ADurb.Bin012]HNQ60175.1 DUF4290 domain-containing protein [Bacteroidales bacterium]HNU21735.1 DUF4290 domain-containing protein [Bacteroidales bacterium]HNV17375.1 DUF4290 domain-containing protein [Bacteroidales bacterium]HOC16039.1 DUF4290 domain-containing protein [Bacteroidales bacterium]
MEYNTTRGPLKMAEYGRNIQKMVEYIIQIPDREERTRAAQALVKCMEQITPEQKDYTDYKRKLWDHLHIISDFRLDVDAPYPLPSKEQVELKPQPIPYSDNKIKYRHYGRNVQKMIDYVSTLDTDHPDRKAMIRVIGNSMKMAYLTWNRDNVADDVILEQMKELSDGKIDTEGIKLAPTNELLQIIRQQQKLQPVAKPGNKKKRKHK